MPKVAGGRPPPGGAPFGSAPESPRHHVEFAEMLRDFPSRV